MLSFLPRRVSALAVSAVLAGCQSAPERPPAVVVPAPKSQVPQAPSSEPTLTTDGMLALLAELDAAFARENCARVAEIAATLRIPTSAKSLANVPATTAAAVSLCDSLQNAKDAGRAKTAARVLEDLTDRAPPALDKAWIERMRAERLLAAKQEDKALSAKKKELGILQAHEQRQRSLELDIYELSDATAKLSADDRAAFRRIMGNAQSDARLFDVLRELDDILARTSDAEARAALVTERSHVVARLEQLFAVEVAQLEEKRSEKRDAEARAQAQEMKRRFPTRSYEMRIDAVMGDATVPPSGNAVSGTLETDRPAGVLDAPVTEASILEKALGDARAAMNSGDPAAAVNVLDGIPEKDRNDKVRRLRKEAAELHTKELRTRVREIYGRANSQANKQLKLDALKQCKEILELILSRYPDTSSRPGVERNLKSINSEIEFLSKGS